MFASSLHSLQAMACICDHSKSSHENIGGALDSNGKFLTRQTAEYPSELAEQFAAIITLPLFSTHARDIQWDNRSEVIPIKGLIDPPKSSQDGGGVHSIPDSSTPHTKPDIFRQIRRPWMQHIINNKWHLRTLAHMEQRVNTPIFSDDEVSSFRKSLDELR